MASVNKVILVGNLGRDPETRYSPNGGAICNVSIATTRNWKDKASGERKEKTEWHRVVIFNENLVRVARDYLRKGSKVYIEGQLRTRKWQDQSGNDRYTTEVVLQGPGAVLTMLDGAPGSGGQSGGRSSGGGDWSGGSSGYGGGDYDDYGSTSRASGASAVRDRAPEPNFSNDLDDEVPF